MKPLSVESSYADERNGIIVIKLKGNLDHTNFNQLESTFQSYLGNGYPKFICDMKALESASSYSIGALRGFLKFVRLNCGDMVLVNLPQPIKSKIKTITTPENVSIFKNEEEAIEFYLFTKQNAGHYHFNITINSETITCGVHFKVRIDVMDPYGNIMEDYDGITHIIADHGLVYPTIIKNFINGHWEGEMIVSQPGQVHIRAWDDHGIGVAEIETELRGKEVDFPISVKCPGCHVSNVVGKADVFRCVHCNEIYFVDKFGHIIPLRPGETSGQGIVKRLEFTMPSDVNYLNHVRNFIVGVSAEEKIDDDKVAQIEMSLDEALANVIEHAYSYDAYQQINISVALYEHQLEIILRDQGRSFDSENTPLPDLKKHIEERRVGGLGRYLMKTLMDEVDYQSDGRYNQIRMVKKF